MALCVNHALLVQKLETGAAWLTVRLPDAVRRGVERSYSTDEQSPAPSASTRKHTRPATRSDRPIGLREDGTAKPALRYADRGSKGWVPCTRCTGRKRARDIRDHRNRHVASARCAPRGMESAASPVVEACNTHRHFRLWRGPDLGFADPTQAACRDRKRRAFA